MPSTPAAPPTALMPGNPGTDRDLIDAHAYRARPADLHIYLGTHEISWLRRLNDVPLFISHPRLARQKRWPRARTSWALDSGGFTQITKRGSWDAVPPQTYVDAVLRYDTEIGSLEWAAPQDWMCEDVALAATGLTVDDHQRLTLDNYLDLTHRWTRRADADSSPFVPVLQARPEDPAGYLRHADAYERAGIDLATLPLVGVGSVCRLQATIPVRTVMAELAARGYRLHGFGVKAAGLVDAGGKLRLAEHLASCDSLAWSVDAYRAGPAGVRALDGCGHQTCSNCLGWALHWRTRLLDRVRAAQAQQTLVAAA